jgi:hypothetical protein
LTRLSTGCILGLSNKQTQETMTHTELIQQIIKAVIEQNEQGNDAFFSFSGHVNLISVYVYDGSFDNDTYLYNATSKLDGTEYSKTDKSLETILSDLKRLPVTPQSHVNKDNKLKENN